MESQEKKVKIVNNIPAITADGHGLGINPERTGANVASANNLTLGSGGNTFHITGTTQINLLDNTSWQGGSEISLIFDGALTVKHNQTISTTFAPIMLAGGVDLATAADNVLTLVYDSTNSKWYERSRKVQATLTGSGTLSAGTVTISTSGVTASSKIFLTDTANGANLGILSVGTITAGTSFVVNSSNVLDAGTFNWLIIN